MLTTTLHLGQEGRPRTFLRAEALFVQFDLTIDNNHRAFVGWPASSAISALALSMATIAANHTAATLGSPWAAAFAVFTSGIFGSCRAA